MCTITWYIKDDEYAVFFNRDEKKWRQEAIPPQFFYNRTAIMPIDPDGNGTWIGVNQYGYSFCLLNNYQADAIHHPEPSKGVKFLTRGKLIPDILQLDSLSAIYDYLEHIDYGQFRPFLLVIFAPPLIFTNQVEVPVYSWNGVEGKFVELKQPIISTAIKFQQAKQYRVGLFQQLIAGRQVNRESHFHFHRSHEPEAGPLSVCMHRDDASSVSFSHISVADSIRFFYQSGFPCQINKATELSLEFLSSK